MTSNLTVKNSIFSGNNEGFSAIDNNRGSLIIDNSDFKNYNAHYGAILNYKGDYFSIKNSNFSNSHAMRTGGAILAKFFPNEVNEVPMPSKDMIIENCSFTNLSSESDGGIIYMDLDSGSAGIPQTLNIVDSKLINSSSKFGGVIVNLGGNVNIKNSKFINNTAKSTGGAIYTSWTNLTIDSSVISQNIANSNASAIYFDKGIFTINNSNITDNHAPESGNVIYANDASNHFTNSIFDNNGVIYGNFNGNNEIKNLTSKDQLSLNNTDYIFYVENKGIKLNLKNNTDDADKLPVKYDGRDYGLVTPIKVQGDNFACWTFATAGAIESSLLKSTGKAYNISENNIQNIQLKYNPVGDTRNNATGFAYSGLGHSLSWNGIVTDADDPYDERGMISEVVKTNDRIHLQDARIIFGGKNDTVDSIKQSIIKYGAVSIQFTPSYNTYDYNDKAVQPVHFVTLIGWDDTIPAKKFKNLYDTKSPSKPGGWLYKNSEGSGKGDGGYGYISYYDKSFLANDYHAIVPQAAAVAYIFENNNDYHVNYQTDLTGLAGFDDNYTMYSNEFTSKYNESIGAVGTYFNDSGVDYSFDIYVNGAKVHTQSGASEFAGFKTIVLDNYVPVKTGDKFKVVFKNNNLPYQAFSRQHYAPGVSFAGNDGQSWKDMGVEDKTVCLKVYTL